VLFFSFLKTPSPQNFAASEFLPTTLALKQLEHGVVYSRQAQKNHFIAALLRE
jgi:hypothetical protein